MESKDTIKKAQLQNQPPDKTKSVEPINYYYLATSVVLLIICYYFLCSTENKLRIKKIEKDNIESKSIKVRTSKGEILMDPNIFEMHIKRMRGNIFELNKKFTSADCANIKRYIDNTKSNITSYININTDDIDPSFCDSNSNMRLIDDNAVRELELLKHKLTKAAETDSGEDLSNDKMRYSMLEILIDMDIILFLVRSSMCKNGVLDISAIDGLIMELYRNNCMNNGSNNKNITKKITKEPELFMDLDIDNKYNNIKKIINSDTARHSTNSQSTEYGNSTHFENNLSKTNLLKPTTDPATSIDKTKNLISISHDKPIEFNNNVKSTNLDNIFNISKLNGIYNNKKFSIFSRLDADMVDNTGRTSLN
jgi:hypothetical protein